MLFKYDVDSNKLIEVDETDFTSESLTELGNIEEWVRKNPKLLTLENEDDQIKIIGKQTVSETKRRSDLIGVDRNANIVIIELKRDLAEKMTEIQAIQYASFYLNLDFEDVKNIFAEYLKKCGKEFEIGDVNFSELAEKELKEFLPLEIDLEEDFNTNQRIILAAGDFDSDLKSAVTWLILKGIQLECIELNTYKSKDGLFVVPRRILPTKELSENLVKIKVSEERVREKLEKKRTKFELEEHYNRLHDDVANHLRQFVKAIDIEPINLSDSGFHLKGKENKLLISTWMKTKFEVRFSKADRKQVEDLFKKYKLKLQLKDKATAESWGIEKPTPSVDFKGEKEEFEKLVNLCKEFLY